MSWSFRQIKKINYAEPDLTDDYGTFGTFSINQNDCYVQFQSEAGLLIAGEASYPYFVHDICWVNFTPSNNDKYYFEKQVSELNDINGIDKYYQWVKSKYKYLLPNYRQALLTEIPIKYKYSIGDIIFMDGQNDIGQIKNNKYDIETNSILYDIGIIDLNQNSLISLKYCNDIIEDKITLGITALDCFNKFNNNAQTIQSHALYIREKSRCCLETKRYNTLKEICFEFCEHILEVMNDTMIGFITSRKFVNQYRSVSEPITKNMFLTIMITWLKTEYYLSEDVWQCKNSKIKSSTLTLDVYSSIFSVDATQNKMKNGWVVFVAEPVLIWKDNEMSLFVHICDVNPSTKFINGDPDRKRERIKKYNKFKAEGKKFYKQLVYAYVRQNTHGFEITSKWINGYVGKFFGLHKVKAYRNYLLCKEKEQNQI